MQDTRKFDRIEAVILGDGYLWLKPHLGVPAAALNVDMPRLPCATSDGRCRCRAVMDG